MLVISPRNIFSIENSYSFKVEHLKKKYDKLNNVEMKRFFRMFYLYWNYEERKWHCKLFKYVISFQKSLSRKQKKTLERYDAIIYIYTHESLLALF